MKSYKTCHISVALHCWNGIFYEISGKKESFKFKSQYTETTSYTHGILSIAIFVLTEFNLF